MIIVKLNVKDIALSVKEFLPPDSILTIELNRVV